jgi:hypothetical protein
MDASPAQSGIHGENGGKNFVGSNVVMDARIG